MYLDIYLLIFFSTQQDALPCRPWSRWSLKWNKPCRASLRRCELRTNVVVWLSSERVSGLTAKCALQAFGNGFYRGGFDPKMNKREAALILGVRYVNIIFQTSSNWLSYSTGTSTQTIKPVTVMCTVPQPTRIRSEKPTENWWSWTIQTEVPVH